MTYEDKLEQIEIDRRFFLIIANEVFLHDWEYPINDL